MLVISVLCFSIECGLGGAFCGGDLLFVPEFLVVQDVMSSNNLKRANHFGGGETFLIGLKQQGVRVLSASVWFEMCLLS